MLFSQTALVKFTIMKLITTKYIFFVCFLITMQRYKLYLNYPNVFLIFFLKMKRASVFSYSPHKQSKLKINETKLKLNKIILIIYMNCKKQREFSEIWRVGLNHSPFFLHKV